MGEEDTAVKVRPLGVASDDTLGVPKSWVEGATIVRAPYPGEEDEDSDEHKAKKEPRHDPLFGLNHLMGRLKGTSSTEWKHVERKAHINKMHLIRTPFTTGWSGNTGGNPTHHVLRICVNSSVLASSSIY